MTEELRRLLAAVGNHEAKALLLAAMRPGERYRPPELRRLLLAGQGRRVRWACNSSRARAYCDRSLVPAGLVEPPDGDDGYRKTRFGARRGDAFVGHLLGLASEHRGVSLAHLFGATNSSAKRSDERGHPTVKRGAETRLRLFAALAAGPDGMTATELATSVREPLSLIHDHLAALRRGGVLSYISEEAYRTLHFYVEAADAPQEAPAPYRTERTLTAAVLAYSKGRHGGAFSRSDVHAALVEARPGWGGVRGLKDRISSVLNHLAARGYIERVILPRGKRSEVRVSPAHRTMLQDYVSVLDTFRKHGRRFTEEGVAKASDIVRNPEVFTRLLLHSKITRNKPYDVCAKIVSIVERHPKCATVDIERLLAEEYDIRLSTDRINQLLTRARAAGLVRAERRGRAFFYSGPDEPGARSARGRAAASGPRRPRARVGVV